MVPGVKNNVTLVGWGMHVRASLAIFLVIVCDSLFSTSVASDNSVRTVFIDAICTAAQRENRAVPNDGFWEKFRVSLVAHAIIDWTFDRTPLGGDNDQAALYWDDIDDPLAAFLAAHELAINQKRLGLFFKKMVTEAVLCQGCSVLFTALEELPSCGHAFCEACILQHYTAPCLCGACSVNRNESPCARKKLHLTCPRCNIFMRSDFIYALKQKPGYASFMFKDIGRRHRVVAARERRKTI